MNVFNGAESKSNVASGGGQFFFKFEDEDDNPMKNQHKFLPTTHSPGLDVIGPRVFPNNDLLELDSTGQPLPSYLTVKEVPKNRNPPPGLSKIDKK